MKLGSGTSGGSEHVELVKLTTKRIVDRFQNLKNIQISYEAEEFAFDLAIKDAGHPYKSASLEFRPDIVLRIIQPLRRFENKWSNVHDSEAIVFEIETDPKNIFNNRFKIESYKKIKQKVRSQYAFILVVWDDVSLSDDVEPFDEVWKFPRELKEK